jgi:hypothetical protein
MDNIKYRTSHNKLHLYTVLEMYSFLIHSTRTCTRDLSTCTRTRTRTLSTCLNSAFDAGFRRHWLEPTEALPITIAFAYARILCIEPMYLRCRVLE